MSVHRLLLAVAILNLALPPAAEACSCGDPFSVAEQFELSDAVFYGEVVSRRVEADCEGCTFLAVYTFRVLQSWKGVTGEFVGLITPENEAACGSDFEVGELRLVYATVGGLESGSPPGVLLSPVLIKKSTLDDRFIHV